MPQPVRLSAQQEQDELVKFSGCTMSTETGPSTVPLTVTGHGDACTCPGRDRPGASPHNTLCSCLWVLSLQAGGFVN